MNYRENFNGKHFDVGTGQNISLNEIKEIVLKFHLGVEFDYVEPRKGDVLLTRAETNSLRNLGWTHSVSLEDGLGKCFWRKLK